MTQDEDLAWIESEAHCLELYHLLLLFRSDCSAAGPVRTCRVLR